MSATYRVTGMTCDGCARAVTRAITGAATGATVNVDLAAKTVTVEGGVDSATIRRAVSDAGFTYEGPIA